MCNITDSHIENISIMTLCLSYLDLPSDQLGYGYYMDKIAELHEKLSGFLSIDVQ